MSPALLLLAATAAAPPEPARDLKLPPGFSAKLYADNPLAPDIYTLALDDAGRVLVAGRGYVRVLVDDDNDGSADRAIDLIDGLKEGPMGLLAEGDSLFVVSDGGLKRYRGYNGRDRLKEPELLLALKTGGEHAAHAVRRGPDGWLYLLCGNNAGVRKELIRGDRSPVMEPVAGALLRLSPDFKTVEIVADGFRNPYSFDFNLDGEPFAYDSDNERCVGLPWYEGCRFYHVVPGGNHGWRSPQLSQTWRKPPYFPDVVPPICDTGRGSPTGVACYRHAQFPEAYRGGFFLADWTFGRIYHVPLKASGSSYGGKYEVFAEATGTSGFAPTALAVHPQTGELFVSIGGRGTRGGVYRVRYENGDTNPKPLPIAKRSLDFDKEAAAQWLADATGKYAPARRRALELIWRWSEKLPWGAKLNAAVKANLAHEDRLIRQAAGRVGRLWFVELGRDLTPLAKLTLALETAKVNPTEALKVALATLENKESTPAQLVTAMRVIHLAFGDLTAKGAMGTVWEGYTLRDNVPRKTAEHVTRCLVRVGKGPPDDADYREVHLEVARLLAAVGQLDTWKGGQATLWFVSRTSPYADDSQYLIAIARLSDSSEFEGRYAADALFTILEKIRRERVATDRHWPLRVEEVVARLAKNISDFSTAVIAHPDFGRPEHAFFARALGEPPEKVAERFLAAAEKDRNYAWTPAAVELLAALPPEKVRKTLRELAERPGLEEVAARMLAAHPDAADRAKFVAGLKSLDAELVRACAHALTNLPAESKSEVVANAIRALRRFPDEKPNAAVRAELVALLQKSSGEKIGADAKAWAAWLAKSDPAAAKKLEAADGYDAAKWQARLAGIDWSKGDAPRGRAVFAKATCAACHDRAGAVGPSLLGIAKRFSRDDLLTAILQPSKDVSPRYRPTRVVTTDDKAYTGILVYEATDGVILQTGADTSVRLAGAVIASMKAVEVSLMPTGLIDKLTDTEIADLLAYLATVGL
jgi:putative heme-binding domain-containing protein